MNDAVERELNYCLRRAASAHNNGPEDLLESSDLIANLEELGLLSRSEATEWTDRLERFAEDPLDRPIRPREEREAAIEWFERERAELEARSWRSMGARDALAYAGLLTGDEHDRLHDPPDAERVRSRQTHLVGQILGPEDRMEGLRVLAVDLYVDGCSLVWHLSPISRLRTVSFWFSEDAGDDRLTLADAVGTSYRWQGGTGGPARNDDEVRGYPGCSNFAPVVPGDAQWLSLRYRESSLRIPLL